MSNLDLFENNTCFEKTLPSSWYIKSDLYSLEREHIFLKDWVFVVRAAEIPKHGVHQVLDI